MPQDITPLRPVASPTDQFSAPEVRRPNPPTGLAQLAQSLSDLNPNLLGVYETLQQRDNQKQEAMADADVTRLHIQNQQDFKKAVDQGQLAQNDNPWYMKRLRQNVAQIETRQATQGAWDQYLQSPLRFTGSPQQVDEFLNQQYAPLLQNRTAGELQVMGQQIEQDKKSIIDQHIATSNKTRQDEMAATFDTNYRSTLRSVSADTIKSALAGDADAQQSVTQMQQQLNAQVDELGKIMPWTQANQLAISAARDEALGQKNADVYDVGTQGIQTAGGKLSDTGSAKSARTTLSYEIAQKVHEDLTRQESTQQLQAHQDGLRIFGEMNNRLSQLQANGRPEATLADVQLSPADFAKLNPRVQEDLLQLESNEDRATFEMRRSNESAKSDFVMESILPKIAQGTVTDDDYIHAATALSLTHAADKYEMIERLRQQSRLDGKGVTTEDTRISLMKQADAGTLTANKVFDLYANHQIADRDLGSFYQLSQRGQSDRGPLVNNVAQSLEAQIQKAFQDRNGITDSRDLEGRQDLDNLKKAGVSEFYQRVNDLQGQNLGRSDYQKKVEEIRDDVSRGHGGLSYDDWQKAVKKEISTPAVLPKGAANEPPSTAQDITQNPLVKKDPVASSVTSDDVANLAKAVKSTPIDANPLKDNFNPPPYMPSKPGKFDMTDADPLQRLIDFRHRYPIASEEPTEYLGGFIKTGQVVDDPWNPDKQISPHAYNEKVQKYEIQEGTNAVKSLTRMKLSVSQDIQDVKNLTARYQQNGGLTQAEHGALLFATDRVQKYLYYRSSLPFTVEDAKTVGDSGWRQVPLFFNELDLRTRGKDIATQFGLKSPEELANFISSQKQLITNARNAYQQ